METQNVISKKKKLNVATQESYSSQISYVKMENHPARETMRQLFSCRYLFVRMLKMKLITKKEAIITLTVFAVCWDSPEREKESI